MIATGTGYLSQEHSVHLDAGETVEVDFELRLENQALQIDSFSVVPDVLLPGENASVVVEAHDPDGSELTYFYEATDGFEIDEADKPGQAILTAPDEFGVEATVTVRVQDEAGDSATDTVTVQTRGNENPVIESISAIPEQLEPGETGLLNVQASDPDGDELFYHWQAPQGWELGLDDEAEVEITAPNEPDETAIIQITVSDGHGGEVIDDVIVTTSENRPPVITAINADPTQVEPGGEMELTVDAYDPEDGESSYEWFAPADWSLTDEDQATARSLRAQ